MSSWTRPGLPARWSATSRPAFVGRHHELVQLEQAWAAVTDGARQAVFVGAEPGAGKSRLVAEASTALSRAGAAVLVGGCVAELGLPYQPLDAPAEVLRTALVDGSLTLPPQGPQAVQAVVQRLASVAGREHGPPGVADLDGRRETGEALVAAVRAAADRDPVVLLLEDLHWAGTTALQLLAYLLEHTADSRLLVLATLRTTTPDRSPELLRQMALLHRLEGVRLLDLGPLAPEDVADFLVREAGLPASRARQAAVVLHDRTGGNPFFLRELWRDLARSGGLSATAAAGAAPAAVRDTVAQRTAALSPEHRDVLDVAAVVGEDVDVALLGAVCGRRHLLPGLDALADTGLLEPVPGRAQCYRFAHSLARQAVTDLMSSAHRAWLHERVAQALETRGAAVQQLAHHYAAAALLGHTGKAVHYLDEAARVADRSLAHAEAATLLERAAGLCEDLVDRDEHLLAAARRYQLACDFSRARELALVVATHGTPDHRLRAATVFEDVGWHTVGNVRVAHDLLQDALASVRGDPCAPDRVRALAGLARATAHTGEHDRAELLAAEAVELARRTGGDQLLGDALAAAMQVGVRPGSARRKLPRALELSAVALRTGQWLHLGPASYHRSVMSYQSGDRTGVAVARRDLERTAEASGQQYWSYLAGCVDVGDHLLSGRFALAAQASADLLEMGESFGGPESDGPYGVQSYMLRRETGALGPARALLTGDEQPGAMWAPALLALYTDLGLTAGAARLLQHVLDTDLADEQASSRWPATLCFLVEAAIALEDRDAAERLRPMLEEYAGLNVVMGPFVAVFGAADRFVAQLDALLGRPCPDARFAAALELDTRTRAPLHRAHTLAAWSRHAARTGDLRRAQSLADEARALAEPAGMARVLTALDRSVPRAGGGRDDRLTPREMEVLALLGEGLSNRTIAARLVISENTAANHVRSILIKTQCENRTQAAMYAARHGAVGTRGAGQLSPRPAP